MGQSQGKVPDHTAVRVALWRALHVELDLQPHIFGDQVGVALVGDPNWRLRPDMDPAFSKPMRASIVGRARFSEDLVEEQVRLGVNQYIILGAGLDTFAVRRQDLCNNIEIFEIDEPRTQAWKKGRIAELGLQMPGRHRFVPVDFEGGESWWERLSGAGFDPRKPAIVVSTGLSMYLTRAANTDALTQLAQLAPGSTFAMTFMLSLELLDASERSTVEFVMTRAKEAGTPFLSLFDPGDLISLATGVGFREATYVSANDLFQRYFANRKDGLRAGKAEAFIVART